jgi:hypothetical protein
MAGLQREHDGREQTKVDAYAIKDMIVVVVRSKHVTPQGARGGVHSHG